MSKAPTSFRLSVLALRQIKALSVRLGISQAAVVEQAVRLLARKENVGEGEGNG